MDTGWFRVSDRLLPDFPTFGLSDSRTFGLSDVPTFGLSDFPTFRLSDFPTATLSLILPWPENYPVEAFTAFGTKKLTYR
jgi:hypothetical protein